ncbi:uncharacterized protein LOC105188361 [Harpegnathos saltator]|uniref:uncharacterized protein LOC105188361 n=1 Tax=Harpegnathos saltator TaxID=610380 RepID=UPI000DBED9EA|nr:uncharacterized protein LOC105188361 [Harpegnathos saltator]
MISMADVAHHFANIIFIFNVFVAFSLSIGEHFVQSMNEDNRLANSTRELPIKMEFPFEVSKSPIFECFLIGQFLYDMVIACIVGMVNSLLVSLVLHVSGQIDIMRQNLEEFSNNKSDPDTFFIIIKNLIVKHQQIISLSENIEDLFSLITLMQILWNTIVICLTGFVIIITIDKDVGITSLMKSVSYYIDIMLEIFIICFAGEFLSAKSKSISDALYETLWYNMSPSDSRILLFMILRSQKRLTITAGKVIDLTLEGFTTSKSIDDAMYKSLWYDMPSNDSRILLFVMLRSQKRLTTTADKVDLTLERFTSVLHLSGQIDIMRQDLEEFSNNKSDPDTFFIIIKNLIVKHQKIISLSENIENLFSSIALMQILWNTVVICLTGFVIIIVLHVGSQIDILRQDLMQISIKNDPCESLFIIKDLVFKHRKIIALSDKIENVFTAIALMQLLWNTLIICCSGLMIVITLSTNKNVIVLAKSMLLYVAKTIEVFVFCYAGEFLSAKSKSISDAVYESLWYDMLPTTSRVLLFIIVRSQKRLTITAGKVVDLTLDGFMSVMKASASYMSVLHAMY